MSKYIKYCLSILIIFLSIGLCKANNRSKSKALFSFEILPGGALVLPSPLFIHQNGYPDLNLTAHYKTQSFQLPIYYSIRIGAKTSTHQAFELEMNHLKITLNNKPAEIEHFSITHGFNQLWLNYCFQFQQLQVRAGLGPVIAHPESIIRGKQLEGNSGITGNGYYVTGISTQLSLQKKMYFGNHFFLSLESKLNAAYAKVSIVNGYAKVPVVAFHGLCGIGCLF